MRVVPPLEINAGRLSASNVNEPGVGEVAYDDATAYVVGDRRIVGAPTSTVTISNASPAVVSWSAHKQPVGTPVVLTTTGVLPAPLVAGRVYYVRAPAAGTFQLSETPGGAPIVTTSAGSGTHTATTFIHRIYEALAAIPAGTYPPADVLTSAPKWLDIGPTNKWAMFDLLRNTATSRVSPLVVEITPGQRIDSIGLLGLVADSVTVEMKVLGVTVFSETHSLSGRDTTTWSEYLFGVFSTAPSLALFNLPPYTNGVLAVTITKASGLVSCGGIVIGTSVYLGDTEINADSDADNFSLVKRNDFGDAQLLQRRSIPKIAANVLCPKMSVNKARAVRTDLNAVPALWSWLDDPAHDYFDAGLILGFYRRFGINLSYPDHAMLSLEIEEV